MVSTFLADAKTACKGSDKMNVTSGRERKSNHAADTEVEMEEKEQGVTIYSSSEEKVKDDQL